jgi:hypothetical protein
VRGGSWAAWREHRAVAIAVTTKRRAGVARVHFFDGGSGFRHQRVSRIPRAHPGVAVMTKLELLSQVRTLVADVTRARFEGGAYAKMMRAHGYADGYMRALLDAGLVDRAELLRAVGNGRTDVVGGELEAAPAE